MNEEDEVENEDKIRNLRRNEEKEIEDLRKWIDDCVNVIFREKIDKECRIVKDKKVGESEKKFRKKKIMMVEERKSEGLMIEIVKENKNMVEIGIRDINLKDIVDNEFRDKEE